MGRNFNWRGQVILSKISIYFRKCGCIDHFFSIINLTSFTENFCLKAWSRLLTFSPCGFLGFWLIHEDRPNYLKTSSGISTVDHNKWLLFLDSYLAQRKQTVIVKGGGGIIQLHAVFSYCDQMNSSLVFHLYVWTGNSAFIKYIPHPPFLWQFSNKIHQIRKWKLWFQTGD